MGYGAWVLNMEPYPPPVGDRGGTLYRPEIRPAEMAVATVSDFTEKHVTGAPYWYDYQPVAETDLIARFMEAMEKLEELTYAVYGAVPDYVNGILWHDRPNPRCLWPEQITRTTEDTGLGLYEWRKWYQYPAQGHTTGVVPWSEELLGPRVPIRSRSEDPAKQFKLARHNAVFFPADSVERYYPSSEHFDPYAQQTHWRYPDPSGSPCWVRYTPPDDPDLLSIQTVSLVTSVGTSPMVWSESDGYFEAVIPIQLQGNLVNWYIELVYDAAPTTGGDLRTVYDPDTASPTPPDPDDRYTVVFFSHLRGPYSRGFPELITRLGQFDDTVVSDPSLPDGGLRKTTERWQFDSLEDIPPQHINMARYILTDIGRRSQHNPDLRGDPQGCCYNMPIRWRWSGSNVPGQYVDGGKAGADGYNPLTNVDDILANEEARKSWRGLPMVFESDPFEVGEGDNTSYGGNESWLHLYPDVRNSGYSLEFVGFFNDTGRDAGLQPGDVIAPVHLEEIIAAVNYLVNNGVWDTVPINSARMTPFTVQRGIRCASYVDAGFDPPIGDGWTCENQCCDYCPPDGTMDDCVGYPEPAWADCSGNNRCNYYSYKYQSCQISWPSLENPIYNPDVYDYGCGFAWGGLIGGGDVFYDCSVGADRLAILCQVREAVNGWTAYLCGPRGYDRSPGDGGGVPDVQHGNWFRKRRLLDNDTDPTQAMPSFGNSYSETKACGYESGTSNPVPELGFEQVIGVRYDGLVSDAWWEKVNCNLPWMYDTWPEIPGLGYYDLSGARICFEEVEERYNPGFPPEDPLETTTWACEVSEDDVSFCRDDTAYVRIDLNVQGDGMPRLRDFEMSAEGAPGVPEWSDCPCDTSTVFGQDFCEDRS